MRNILHIFLILQLPCQAATTRADEQIQVQNTDSQVKFKKVKSTHIHKIILKTYFLYNPNML